ncbi:MAG: hypothetical protein ACOYNJ_09100, partial [Candidatus Nanopelagicales bacterium]
MRPTRLIYVENDPALRGIMSTMLDEAPEIDLIFSTGVAHEALDPQLVQRADAALLDLALVVDGPVEFRLLCGVDV